MQERARNKPFRQLPIQSFSEVDNIGDVLEILRELERGSFYRAAQLGDAMERDDRIRAVMETRIGALKATKLDIQPGTPKRLAVKLAKRLTEEWDRIIPASVVGDLTRWGNLLGIGVAEIIWDTSSGVWATPRLKVWHPQFLRWDWATFSYKLLTAEGEIELPKIDENPSGDGRWIVWCPHGYQYAWLRGLLRALAPKFVMRGWTYRDWSRWCEVHGQGIVKAVIPTGHSNDEEGDQFFESVANRGSEPTIKTIRGAEGEGNDFDIELVEAESKTWDGFQAEKQALDVDIAVLWLGCNLSTESPAGGSSSKSLGEVQAKVTGDRLKSDAGIAPCIRQQLLTPWAVYNVDDATMAPLPVYETEPEDDNLKENTALKMLADALTALKALSDRVDYDTILEDQGVDMKTPEQVAAEKAVAAEEAARNPPPTPPAPVTGTPGAPPPPPHGAAPVPAQPPSGHQPPPTGKRQRANALRGTGPLPQVVSRRTFAGMPVAVESPAGSIRIWSDENKQQIGSTTMLYDYGFLEGVEGSDGEELDVYLGPDENAPDVHVVHQLATPDYKKHDEDKTMLGFRDAGAAKTAYLAHRNDGDKAFGGMSVIPMKAFKRKLKRRTGTGKIRATAIPDVVAAIGAMLERGHRHATTLTKKADRRRYTDELTTKAIKLGARSLAADLAHLKVEIGDAKSLPDLLKRLERLYKNRMDPADFARLIQKVRLMSHLAGAASVHKEIAA